MRASLFAAAALFTSSLAAHADTLIPYQFSATYTNGGTVTGNLTLDSTTGVFTANLIAAGFPYGSGSGYTDTSTSRSPIGTLVDVLNDTLGCAVELVLPVGSFTGYSGLTIAVTADDFENFAGGHTGTNSSALSTLIIEQSTTPAGVTPEPPGIALLSTGLLGVAGLLRRRLG